MRHLTLFLCLLAFAATQAQKKVPHPGGKRIVKLTEPVPGCVDIGDGYFDCEERAELPDAAEVLSDGQDRFRKLKKADKDKVEKEPGVQPHRWLGEPE